MQLRRGILEHLESRRITVEEYSIYTLIILKADHRNGTWKGCALALARLTGKSKRWCAYKLASLRGKGYLSATPTLGRGQYLIRVNHYFQKVHLRSPSEQEGAPGVTFQPKKVHPRSPYQEVRTQEKRLQEVGRTRSVDSYPYLRMPEGYKA